jgi:hypothetical protein
MLYRFHTNVRQYVRFSTYPPCRCLLGTMPCYATRVKKTKHNAKFFIRWLPPAILQTVSSHSSLLIEYRTSPSSIPAGGVS